VVKPFLVRFSEGLADLAVHIIELKAKRRWPGLANATYEIVAKQSSENQTDDSQGGAKEFGTCPPGRAGPEEQATGGADKDQSADGGWAVPR
jgi:hypothetical protein